MDLSNEHLEVAFDAWLCAQHGLALVVDADHFVAAHQLCEQGWLKREPSGETMAWRWTEASDVALLNAALVDVEGREN
jgi:hypothetical protein